MKLEPVVSDDPRDVLRGLRAALNGSGPALGVGMLAGAPTEVPAGTAVVVTTSGSTGTPKSVVLSRNALTASALATAARIGEGSWLLALPASYVAGLQVLVRSLVQGREPAVLSGRFSPQAFAAASHLMASSEGGTRVPTFTSLVPAQLSSIVDAAADDASVRSALQSFEAILVGGQALAPALLTRAEACGARIVRTYGSTETSGGCIYDGMPLGGVGVREQSGELQISGPTLADGYLGNTGLTDAVFCTDPDGTRWYRTGDAGVIQDGAVRVRGRIDNVIVSGGINVSLDRVENVVRVVPGLEGAVVVGIPHPRWGEASVIVTPRGSIDPAAEGALLADARAAVGSQIGAHARPSRLVLAESMLTLASGKPDREALRRVALHRG